MDLAFATSQLDPGDRLEAWRELVSRVFLPLAIAPIGVQGLQGGFTGTVTGRDVAGVQVWHVSASPMSAVRAPRHIKATAVDDYLLAVHVHGTAHAAQGDRQVTLQPGDFTLIDSSQPYSISFPGPGMFTHVIYQVPRAVLDARGDAGSLAAVRVPAASTAGQLVFPYLRSLAWSASGSPGAARVQAFVDSGLDLAISALGSVAGHQDYGPLYRRSPVSRLTDYALAHLGDPALSPESVASACYVSVRQLHRLFARDGQAFAAWVREQRLRKCRDDLADPRLGHLTVAEIAARWGFRSAAHFSRAFRARYGITPARSRRARPDLR